MRNYAINPDSRMPAYQQLARLIRGDIKSGALPAGSRLPTVRQLADSMGLARGTIKHAYDELEAMGAIEMTRGRGSFVKKLTESDQSRKDRAMKALGEFLRPEFINRVDEIVYFNSLTEENFRSIAKLMLEETRDAIAERGISMTWNTALIDYLVRKSYSVTYGARNLRRTIQKDVEDAIAQKIIDCRGENAGHISVSADDSGVVVEVGE